MSETKKTAAPAAKAPVEAPKKVETPAAAKPAAPVAVKAPAKKPAVKKAVEKKAAAPVKKAAEKKVAEKKAAAPKDVKVSVIVEHHGRQVGTDSIVKTAEKLWVMAGRDAAKIAKVELYVKQEDGAVYCVVNGEAVGKYDL